MSGKKIGYIRVSSFDQNPDRQLEGINLSKKFVDKASGKSMDRPQLDKCEGKGFLRVIPNMAYEGV